MGFFFFPHPCSWMIQCPSDVNKPDTTECRVCVNPDSKKECIIGLDSGICVVVQGCVQWVCKCLLCEWETVMFISFFRTKIQSSRLSLRVPHLFLFLTVNVCRVNKVLTWFQPKVSTIHYKGCIGVCVSPHICSDSYSLCEGHVLNLPPVMSH